MIRRHQLSTKAKEEIMRQLGQLLSQREEIGFACIHGSFLESAIGFRDIDVGVWADSSSAPQEQTLDYEWDLSAWLERHVRYPIDVKVLNYTSLGFRYAASGGTLIFARDADLWYQFRERTWIQYLDFALCPDKCFLICSIPQPSADYPIFSSNLNCPKMREEWHPQGHILVVKFRLVNTFDDSLGQLRRNTSGEYPTTAADMGR